MLNKFFRFFLFSTILLIPFYIFRFSVGPIPSTLLEVLVVITFILMVISGRFKDSKIKIPLLFGGLFVLASLLAVSFDPDRLAALGIFKAYFVDGFLFFMVILTLNDKEKIKAKNFLIISGVITAVIALVLFLNGTKTIDGRLLDLDRLSPNYLAMYLVPIFILNLGEIYKSVKPRSIYLTLSALLLVSCIYLTNSRAGLISIVAGIIVLSFGRLASRINRKTALAIILSLLVILIAFSAWFFRPQANDLGRTGSSSNIRYYIWSTSIEIAKKHLITGIGLDNYQNYFSTYTKGWTNFDEFITPEAHTAHNLYLHIYLTMGLLGIVSFFALIISSKFWKNRDSGLIAALTSIFIFALFDTPFFRNDLAILFWMIIALIYVQRTSKEIAG